MNPDSVEALGTDFLVLGSGIAGLRAALGLARHGRVLVVTKDQPTESNTGYAQGGVAVALATDDEPRLHVEDTVPAGAGIVCEAAARVLGDATGWEMVRALLETARRTSAIRVQSFACSTDLVVRGGRVEGCRFLDED